MKSNLAQIEQMIKAIDISPTRRVFVYGRPFGEEFSNPYVQQPSNKMLFQDLQNVIYTVFYSKNQTALNTTGSQGNLPSYHDIESFMNELSKENEATETFDNGWYIEFIDAQGMVTAKKGNYTRPVHHGEFLNTSGFHHPPTVGESIRLVCRKEHKDAAAGFYYMFGTAVAEDNPDQLVRLYFNIQTKGAKQLIHLLSTQLNKHQVPFNFKCVNHPFFFTRCDSAVLYFDKRYSDVVFFILKNIYPAIKAYLQAEVPLFTRELAGGIGFAENPVNPEESFGTHVSKMLAQGIMNAVSKNAPKTSWLQEIKMNLERQHHYKNIDELYLNPGSMYPYQYPVFS